MGLRAGVSEGKGWTGVGEMKESYEIKPGESIGPFKLGMAREDIERLNIRMVSFEDGSGAEFPSVDVKVYYDASGRCKKIEAIVFGGRARPTTRFMLAGRPVNNVSEAEARRLFRSISPKVRSFYGGFGAPAAGIRALKWENSDDFVFAILVEPPDKGKA
jgi:hypothetical protein